MTVEPEIMRQTMRHWASGVTVVSVQYQGVQHGMTVSSFTSLSLNPPLVLVALKRGTRTQSLITQAGYFGVSILAQSQQAISNRFAGQDEEDIQRFVDLDVFTLKSGSPMISGGMAFLDCRLVEQVEQGSHTLLIGEVLATQKGQDSSPLIYYNQGYHSLE